MPETLNQKITDIFFDLDHTLWDFDKNSALAFEAIFAKNKLEIKLPVFLKTYVPINHKYWERYRYGKIGQEELRFGRLHDTFLAMGFSVSKEAIGSLSTDYIDFLPNSNHLFPYTVKVLEYLEKKYTLHIITDGFEEVQWKKMRNSNIARFFQTVTTSEEAGAKKPNALIFECALKKAGCDKNNSLMIGDNLEADVMGALDYGMQAFYFSKNENQRCTTIDCHRRLMELL